MSDSEFSKQYLQEWDYARERKLYDLAKEYHDRCEAYDQLVCSGPMGRDGILPATPRQYGLVNRHAREVCREILVRAAKQGFSREEMLRAISRFTG